MNEQQAAITGIESLEARDIAYSIHPYTQLEQHLQTGPLVITRGEGVFVFDERGNSYIEAMAGLWCTALGFSNERLAQAALRALRQLPFITASAARRQSRPSSWPSG